VKQEKVPVDIPSVVVPHMTAGLAGESIYTAIRESSAISRQMRNTSTRSIRLANVMLEGLVYDPSDGWWYNEGYPDAKKIRKNWGGLFIKPSGLSLIEGRYRAIPLSMLVDLAHCGAMDKWAEVAKEGKQKAIGKVVSSLKAIYPIMQDLKKATAEMAFEERL
jgi:hypothetical protein